MTKEGRQNRSRSSVAPTSRVSRSSPRRGKYAKVTTAVVIFAVYYNLSALTKKWVEKGVLDTLPGLWWIQLLLAGVLLVLLWQPPMVFFRRGR